VAAGFANDLWTLARVAEVIERVTGVAHHPGHVWRLLKRMRWSLQRPAPKAVERNEAEIARWVAEEWPRIVQTPERAEPNPASSLVISGFVRGLSTRDVEAALGEVLDPEAALSKSTVSRICQAIKDELDACKTRDLGGIELEYLCLDGSQFRMHPGAPAEPVRCAWGITTQGSPVLLGLAPAAHEGHDPWAGFLGELVARGLRAPLLVITDGAPGLIGAVEVVF
jgi:transposase-like protein